MFRWVRDHVVEGVARWVPPDRDLARARGRGPVNPLPTGITGVVKWITTHGCFYRTTKLHSALTLREGLNLANTERGKGHSSHPLIRR